MQKAAGEKQKVESRKLKWDDETTGPRDDGTVDGGGKADTLTC